jgi:hypothetical protein
MRFWWHLEKRAHKAFGLFSSVLRAMPYIPPQADTLNLMSLYAFGLADPPTAQFSTASIVEIANAFSANLMRLKSMMAFPAYLADFASVVMRLTLRAEFEESGEVTIEEKLNDAATAKRLFERFKTLFHEHTTKLQQARDDPDELEKLAKDMGEKGGAVTVIISGSPAAKNAFEFAMMSYITSAWTAFETAAGDVWEAALNHRPQGLADLNGKKRYQKREPRNRDDESQRMDKLIRLELLRSHKWDTAHKMGSILRGQFAFTTLAGIREAFEAAFYKKSDNIDRIILDDTFDQLSALRNVIVHKSAMADAEYERRTKQIPALPKFKNGEKIQLDGKMVADLVHATTQKTFALLSAVDRWLVTNAIKSA